ncbi:hypothetical protein RUM44_000115 [Polyplax serrata]|uniref:Uncharacterized protein n=1 Tax=Polyplax serrata TaxID=468196 RepID=A0ABR1B4H8_POLSC
MEYNGKEKTNIIEPVQQSNENLQESTVTRHRKLHNGIYLSNKGWKECATTTKSQFSPFMQNRYSINRIRHEGDQGPYSSKHHTRREDRNLFVLSA